MQLRVEGKELQQLLTATSLGGTRQHGLAHPCARDFTSLPKFALTATDGGNAGIAGANSCRQICELPSASVRSVY